MKLPVQFVFQNLGDYFDQRISHGTYSTNSMTSEYLLKSEHFQDRDFREGGEQSGIAHMYLSLTCRNVQVGKDMKMIVLRYKILFFREELKAVPVEVKENGAVVENKEDV